MNAFESLLTGRSPALQAVIRAAQVVAATDVNLLVLGETGTGKERMAQAIHLESRRRDRPFIPVNCASLPEPLAESLLFGHRKGSFTGAFQDHQGFIAAADGGTLFLDEMGDLPLGIQAKLLRFIESGECLPVGEVRARKVEVRIIAATHRDLMEQVRQGRFRSDLFYRLNIVPLELPSLRERGAEDLELLLEEIGRTLVERHGIKAPSYSRETLRILANYPWPGNVRELRNFAERMMVLLGGRTIRPENLPREIVETPPDTAVSAASFQLPADGLSLDGLEADMIRQALERSAGNRSRAARLLGLSRDTLLYRIKKYALQA